MKPIFICYPKCSTCREAKKYLLEKEIDFLEKDINLETPTAQELKSYHSLSNLPIRRLFNTSGNSYRELNLKETFDSLTDDERYELLSQDGMLIKRPILVLDTIAFFGFKKEQWDEYLTK